MKFGKAIGNGNIDTFVVDRVFLTPSELRAIQRITGVGVWRFTHKNHEVQIQVMPDRPTERSSDSRVDEPVGLGSWEVEGK